MLTSLEVSHNTHFFPFTKSEGTYGKYLTQVVPGTYSQFMWSSYVTETLGNISNFHCSFCNWTLCTLLHLTNKGKNINTKSFTYSIPNLLRAQLYLHQWITFPIGSYFHDRLRHSSNELLPAVQHQLVFQTPLQMLASTASWRIPWNLLYS